MTTRRLTTNDIDAYREIRLRALRSDPDAFGSSYEDESRFDDITWAQRVSGFQGRAGTVIVAEDDDATVGIVGIAASDVDGVAVLWGMWADPTVRGTGVATQLVGAAFAWAREQRLADVILWVKRSNSAAIAFYERTGFTDANEWNGERPAACTDERCMQMSTYAASS